MTNEEIIARLAEDIDLRGLSIRTKKEYIARTRIFFRYLGSTSAESQNEEDIRRFLKHLIEEKRLSTSSVNGCNSTLRFLYGITLNRTMNYREIPRLKEVSRLTEILTRNELVHFFDACHDLRYKAIFMTIYGGGLRISELCRIRTRDIQSEGMRLFIHQGKGAKDRYTLLSKANLDILRAYWKAYQPNHPDKIQNNLVNTTKKGV